MLSWNPMRIVSRRIALVSLALLASATTNAFAQPDAAAMAKAGALYQRALKRSAAGDHLGAAALMIEAFETAPNNSALPAIGEEFQKANQVDASIKYYCMYLSKEPDGESAAAATEQVATAQRKLGRNVDPATPCVVKKVIVAKPVDPIPTDPPPDDTVGDGTVATPPPVSTTTSTNGSTLRTSGIIAGAVGVVGLGAGIYFTTRVMQAEKDHSDPLKMAQADIDGPAAERNSQIAYIVGGALVVTGITLYVVGSKKRSNAVALAPMLTPSSAGMALGGRF
jgi:hypothetical protein